VSIVTPSFNQAAFLPATLESILSQDYERLELIVMDGGSTDGSVAILEAQRDPRLTWVSEPDRGQSHALNKGLARARGEILTYLNSDDLLMPHTVAFIVDYFDKHPEVDLVTGDCQFISSSGHPLRIIYGRSFDLASTLGGGGSLLQPGTFWRRRVSECIGDFDEQLHYTMDLDYWLRTAIAGFQVVYVPGVRGAFRLHDQSKTVSQSPAFWSDWRTMLEKLYQMPDLPEPAKDSREDAFAYVDWHDAKMAWVERDYVTARPMLRRFLRSKKWVRRGLAAPMLVDSYLGTPFTHLLTGGYKRLSGVDLFAP
jgi:GT2 family glycosyltransferase